MTQKAGDDLSFLVFTSSLVGIFLKLKPPLKISKSTTELSPDCISYPFIYSGN